MACAVEGDKREHSLAVVDMREEEDDGGGGVDEDGIEEVEERFEDIDGVVTGSDIVVEGTELVVEVVEFVPLSDNINVELKDTCAVVTASSTELTRIRQTLTILSSSTSEGCSRYGSEVLNETMRGKHCDLWISLNFCRIES